MANDPDLILHKQNCLDDLVDARNVLKALNKTQDEVLRTAAFKYAVIAYCRAYNFSQGEKGTSRLKLDNSYIPQGGADLHAELIRTRDKIYAHTDRDILGAKIFLVEVTGQKLPLRTQPEFDALELMAKSNEIIELISRTIDNVIHAYSELLARLNS